MLMLTVARGVNYVLVLLYGLFLSVFIAGGWDNREQCHLTIALCPGFILIQGVCWLLLGADTVQRIYPVIVHLPLVLIMVLALKKSMGVSVISVCTAYFCCQLPRWCNIAASTLTQSALLGELVYTGVILPLFVLLLRFFVKPANSAMTYSRTSLVLFGSLPMIYYVFDYATTVYSDLLYSNVPALNELIPTVLVLFYMVFLVAYHQETQERTRAELQSNAQTALLRQAQKEMDALRQVQSQTAVYRHDMRHHLNMIDAFLDTGKREQALAYIRKTREDITSIPVRRFCENEPVNLICSSFADKAARMKIQLTVNARLPEGLSVSDPELCAILSNGLENALNAVADLAERDRWVDLYCGIKLNKLLIEVKNPYSGTVTMENGLPVSREPGHGYGCRSIHAIVLQNQGLYTFQPEGGIFTLQVALPLKSI